MPDGNGRSIHDRALHSVADPQEGLFDRVLEDTALERLLEEREVKRTAKSVAAVEYNAAHETVKARLSEEDLSPGDVIRCGRFRIKVTHIEGGTVSFEKSGADRLFITPMG
jgi:hypothetical protein